MCVSVTDEIALTRRSEFYFLLDFFFLVLFLFALKLAQKIHLIHFIVTIFYAQILHSIEEDRQNDNLLYILARRNRNRTK